MRCICAHILPHKWIHGHHCKAFIFVQNLNLYLFRIFTSSCSESLLVFSSTFTCICLRDEMHLRSHPSPQVDPLSSLQGIYICSESNTCICSESLLVFVQNLYQYFIQYLLVFVWEMRCICGHILPPKWIHCQPEASVTKALPVTGLPCQSSMEAQNKSVFASEQILKIRSTLQIFSGGYKKFVSIFFDIIRLNLKGECM